MYWCVTMFLFSSRRRHTRFTSDWSSDVCSSDLQSNHELVPESMVNELCIAGTPSECKTQLRQFRETGIDLPIIQFNPTDNVEDSFNLVTTTFSEESD